MNNYINIDINSSGKLRSSGLITEMQIKMNNISNVREAILETKKIYTNINEKIQNS